LSTAGCLWLGLLLLSLFFPATVRAVEPLLPEQQRLLLSVKINSRIQEGIQEFIEQDEALFVTPAQLVDMGVIVPETVALPGSGLIDLSHIDGWSYRLDAAEQVVYLHIPNTSLVPQRLNAGRTEALDSVTQRDFGAVLNYDSQFTDYDGHVSASNVGNLRVFGPFGLIESSAVQTHSRNFSRTVRLDSTYSTSDPASLRTYNAGDVINGGLTWTRPIRMMGVQMATNFGLRPDLVTYPRPGMTDEVAVPSSVDIFVNGLRQLSQQVEPGPFELSQLPVTSGGGDISVVVRDASGRETTRTLPFYTSTALLNEGLDSLSIELGSVRRRYATQSNDYGQGAASLSYRHGVTPSLSLETHVESTAGLVMGGVGADMLVGKLGVLSASVATSTFGDEQGLQYGVGFSRTTPYLSFGVNVLKADAHFYDIAAANDDAMPRTTIRANLGIPLPEVGSFSVVYAKKLVNLYLADDYNTTEYVQTSERISSSTLSANLSVSLPENAYGFITAFHDFSGNTGNGMFVGVSIPFGHNATLGASNSTSGKNAYHTVEARQSVVQTGDVGWRLARQTGAQTRNDVGLNYKSPWGLIGAQAERGSTGNSYRATAQGSLSMLDGHFFASNTVYDSFAVVDTDGLPGITVLQENRRVGKTNADGLMFVENLRAYESNRLSIEPDDVPMDVSLKNVLLHVRPADRSGVVAKFPIQRRRSATLLLLDAQQQPIKLGSRVVLSGSGEEGIVGYDGVTFFENLAEHNQVSVLIPGQAGCTVSFDYQPHANAIPRIGPLTCLPGTHP
jgi:outer membrane usher protein